MSNEVKLLYWLFNCKGIISVDCHEVNSHDLHHQSNIFRELSNSLNSKKKKKKITKSIIWWLLFPQMQAFKDTGKAPVETEVAIHRIRITLTSRNVKSLEKGELAQCC